MSKLRVAVVTNVIPHYREAFYRRLFASTELHVVVFCQTAIPGQNLHTVHEAFPDRVRLVRLWSMDGERLGWQWLPWSELWRNYDVMFVQGNPRVLSNVCLATFARCAGKAVVIWGQGHTAGASRITERARLYWWRLFSHIFVYTDFEAQWLKNKGFYGRTVMGMNNGLNQRHIDEVASTWNAEALETWGNQYGLKGRTLVLSCARLDPKNRFDLWLRAMPFVLAKRPDIYWYVIGTGSEEERLKRIAQDIGVYEHIVWIGAIHDEHSLAPWFLSSSILVHPGAIGLTLLHAFGYGLPVVTHNDADNQMPEFHAFEPGATGLLYTHEDHKSLSEAVLAILENQNLRAGMGTRAREVVRSHYNVDVMAERFVRMAIAAGGQQ